METALGIGTTLGLFARWALALGGLLIAALVFGSAFRSDWTTVGIQMIYAITYYLLLANVVDDYFPWITCCAGAAVGHYERKEFGPALGRATIGIIVGAECC